MYKSATQQRLNGTTSAGNKIALTNKRQEKPVRESFLRLLVQLWPNNKQIRL